MFRIKKNKTKQSLESIVNQRIIDVAKPILENFRGIMSYYRCAMMEVETKLNVLNEEFSLQYDRDPISNIKTRLKKLDSIQKKLEKNDWPLTCLLYTSRCV